jgi:protein-S-isoprenylcysteine O-methyltransferase Ste14
MMGVRVLLFSGLVLHKLVWEAMKGRDGLGRPSPSAPGAPRLSILKGAKVAVLGFLLIQTLFLEVLPIARRAKPLVCCGLSIYLIGLALALVGRIQLGKNWANIEDRQLLSGQSLVTSGIYAYIRHPIYIGDVLLITGLQLALNSWLFVGALPLFLLVLKQARAEEALLEASFSGYDGYRRRTHRFIPFLL